MDKHESMPHPVHHSKMVPRRVLGEETIAGTPKVVFFAVIGSVVLFAILLVSGLLFFRFRRRNKNAVAQEPAKSRSKEGRHSKGSASPKSAQDKAIGSSGDSNGSGGAEEAEGELTVPSIPLNDIQVATNGFNQEMVLADSALASVFKAEGPNGEAWAVKKPKRVSIGPHLFRSEVDFLSHVQHPHIVSLVAACHDSNQQILVFEYLSGGPLSLWLRPTPGSDRPALSFDQRLSVAADVADALRFLHSFTKPLIIHRDIKSDTVLLDDKLKAKLGGLGLLKHLPGDALRLRVARRKGYLDPEYFHTFKLTAKCDVYSFGVLLLELLTALPPIIELPPTSADGGAAANPAAPTTLAQWALPFIQDGTIDRLVDPRMPTPETPDSLLWFARIAACCVAPLRKQRPNMATVATALVDLQLPPASRSPAFSRFQASGRLPPSP